jgi:N-methylhydantoinase A
MANGTKWRVGVDIGGTFIDFCALDEATHALHSLKVLTTPDEPGREVMQGMELLRQLHGMQARDVAAFVHGTTVGINTIIQRKGARLALLTTAGFEDVIELARLRMPDMYSLFCARPDQLVPRNRIFGVSGRILSDGSERAPLDETAIRKAVALARERGAEGIIVAFINAYRNPAHEQAAKAIVQDAAPELFVLPRPRCGR